MKKVTIILFAAAMMFACCNSQNQEAPAAAAPPTSRTIVTAPRTTGRLSDVTVFSTIFPSTSSTNKPMQ